MARFSTEFDKFHKTRLSIIESLKNSDDVLKQSITNIEDVSPIIREQRRRSSSLRGSISQRKEVIPSDVFIPNSVVRRSLNSSKEIQLQEDKEKPLSDKELVEKVSDFMQQILKRFVKENVEAPVLEEDFKRSSENFSLLSPKMTMEEKRKARKKKIIDKEKEMKRIIRRTSLLTPFNDGRIYTSEAIREAIAKSEKKHDLLIQPEHLIEQHRPLYTEKHPAELTQSWIKRVSDSLSASAKRISELTEKMTENKETPVTSERPKEKENELPSPIQVQSAPTTPKKKDKKVAKKKSSLKLSKLGSSSYVHPTIHEVDEESPAKRSVSRQTQLSCSSSTRGASVRSSGSLRRRSSSGTGENEKQVQSGSARAVQKDSGKQLSSSSKEKTSKTIVTSKSSLITKETEENLSRKSSVSQKSSTISEKHPGSSSSKHRKSSLKSIASKPKIEDQVSRTSSRARSGSSDDTETTSVSAIEELRERTSLSSLIDLYYASPSRKSTVESLQAYMKLVVKKKEEKPHSKHKKHVTKNESATIRFSDVQPPIDTCESDVVKRDEDAINDEALDDNKKDDIEMKDTSKEAERSELPKPVEKIFSENFENLMNEVTNELRTSFSRQQQSELPLESGNNKENKKHKRSSITGKIVTKEKTPGITLKVRGNTQVKRNSKDTKNKEENHSKIRRSSNVEKSNLNITNENQLNLPVLEKRKTLDTDDETIRYLTSKKIISLSTMRAVRLKNKKIKEGSS